MSENCVHEFEHIFEEVEKSILFPGDISDIFNGINYLRTTEKITDIINDSKTKNKRLVHSICKKCGKIILSSCRHNFVEVYDKIEKINLSEEEVAKILNKKIRWFFGPTSSELSSLVESTKTTDKKFVKIYCSKCGLVIER